MKSDSDVGPSLALEEIIRTEIRVRGAVTFARFMELALYHPEHGYYASGRARIGRKGDFFTNVSVGAVFGKLLAAQFAEVWEKLDRPGEFTIVEQGAHDGQFAADALDALRGRDCFAALNYIIVEPFPVWRERQQEKLRDFAHVIIPSEVEGSRGDTFKVTSRDPSTSLGMTGYSKRNKVSWLESIDQLEPFTGIHFSNELFDALPVHLLESNSGKWRELFVKFRHSRFELGGVSSCEPGVAELRPPNTALASCQRCRTEVSLAAPKLMREIAAKLSRGVILTIDYGFTREEFYSPERSTGTLQVRAQHRKLASPFEQVGLADISAHVEWTSLIEAGESAGAQKLGFTDQHHFLTGILTELLPDLTVADKRGLQTLLHPEMLGRSFQALALGREFGGALSGFNFAREFRSR